MKHGCTIFFIGSVVGALVGVVVALVGYATVFAVEVASMYLGNLTMIDISAIFMIVAFAVIGGLLFVSKKYKPWR